MLLVAACAYYAMGLGVREVSLLESQDFGIASDLFTTFALSPDHSPLHFVFLSFWQRLNSSSVAFLRFPSVVFCSVAALVVFCLAEAIAGTLAGLLAAAFMIFNPDVVDVARSMRLYSLVVLSSSMCLWFAHAYVSHSRQKRHLLGFAASVVVAVYTHLFTWLLIGPLGLLLGIDIWQNWPSAESRRAFRYTWVTLLLLLPQMAHGFATIAFVRDRHGLYSGLPSSPLGFLGPIVRTLFLGESEVSVPLSGCVILVPAALFAMGIASLKKHDVRLVAALALPALCGAWWLSRSSPVEPRYLCFLTPLLAVLMGVGAVRAPKAYWFAPLSLTSIWIFNFASQRTYTVRTDWYDAAATLERLAGPTDVIAVFPGYWAATFRRYTKLHDIAPVTFPIDLERVLARGRRVLLVQNSGRYFGNMDALLSKETLYDQLFASVIRDPLVVYAVSRKRRAPSAPRPNPESILITGTFGSGGFPWQGHPETNPFQRLKTLISGSRIALTGYEPYHPSWYARALLGSAEALSLESNTQTIYQLSRAGISEAVLTCSEPSCKTDADLLTANGIAVVARETLGEPVTPTVFQVGGVGVGVLGITRELLAESPPLVPLQLQTSIHRARGSVGQSGRLIALIPAEPDYGRLATDQERQAARHLIDLGVDVVVGEGGFAAKDIEIYRQGIIAYSLGTLLRPPMLSLAMRESTGLALRLSFPIGDAPRYEAIPLTFDDGCRAVLADHEASRRLQVSTAVDVGISLVEQIASAEAYYRSGDGVQHRVTTLRAESSCLGRVEQSLFAYGASVSRWFPETPPETPLRPFEGVFCTGEGYVARRGVLSLGEYRRAIELETGGDPTIGLRFKNIRLGKSLQLAYGIPDDRLLSKFRPLRDEWVVVEVGGSRVFASLLAYRVGWHSVAIDTSALADTAQDVDISIETNGSHFPVAFDLEIPDAAVSAPIHNAE
jgi:4-amino-4-deoxy-L-arabinose transferase-like glycosyltransferase